MFLPKIRVGGIENAGQVIDTAQCTSAFRQRELAKTPSTNRSRVSARKRVLLESYEPNFGGQDDKASLYTLRAREELSQHTPVEGCGSTALWLCGLFSHTELHCGLDAGVPALLCRCASVFRRCTASSPRHKPPNTLCTHVQAHDGAHASGASRFNQAETRATTH